MAIGHTLRRNDQNSARQALRGNTHGQRRREGHKSHGEEVMNWRWKQIDTLGVTSLIWLGIEMVGGCLFVAYIMLGVRSNDDDDA